jgi:hypothetical protein
MVGCGFFIFVIYQAGQDIGALSVMVVDDGYGRHKVHDGRRGTLD